MRIKSKTIILNKHDLDNLVRPMHGFMVIQYRASRGQKFRVNCTPVNNNSFKVDIDGYLHI